MNGKRYAERVMKDLLSQQNASSSRRYQSVEALLDAVQGLPSPLKEEVFVSILAENLVENEAAVTFHLDDPAALLAMWSPYISIN